MSLLEPGESLKIPSKAFDLISSQIKICRQLQKYSSVTYVETIQQKEEEAYESLNTANEKQKDEPHENEVISKFIITEKYSSANLARIKDSIQLKQVTDEVKKEAYKSHYTQELNKWQKRLRNNREYEQSIAKVNTHPKGKEELEGRKLMNLKQKVVTDIPILDEKKVWYIRSELKKVEPDDIFSNDIWRFHDIQRFINMFFEHYKNFEEIQKKIPHKKVHEIIALYDLLNSSLSLKKFYKKGKQKSSAIRKEYIKNVLPRLKEKLIYLLRRRILIINTNQSIVTLGETKLSRRDLIDCLLSRTD